MADEDNKLKVTDMLRATYRKQVITALQQKTSKYAPFVTWLSGLSGKQVEFNGRGKTEVDFRQQRFEDVVPDEMDFYKRSMIPVGIAKAMHWSEDDPILAGGFAIANDMFVTEMGHGFARISDSLIVGSVWEENRKRWTIAKAQQSLNTKTSFYKGAGIGGILGPAYIGEHLNIAEEHNLEAVTTDGEAFNGKNLDWVNTQTIPVDLTNGTPTVDSINLAKLLAAIQAMEEREGLSDDNVINVGITPSMKYELMKLDEFRNRDYGRNVLVNGFFNDFLNIRFLVTKQVPKVDVGGREVYACPVWRKEDIVAGWWDNIKYDIVQPSRSHDEVLIKAKGAMGCARLRNETVLSILCAA